MKIERNGKAAGRWPKYSMIVDGIDIGEVRRTLEATGDRMHPSIRWDGWAIPGRVVETRTQAENLLIERARRLGLLPPEPNGAYMNVAHNVVHATLENLRYFHRFLESNFERCVDPYSGWVRSELTKPQAQRKLYWLIHVAINRKAGIPDAHGRKQDADYERHLRLDAREANTPNLIVRRFRTPELNRRLAHRLFKEE